MKKFILKKSYELELPNNYISIEASEMEYIDGGANWVTDWAFSVKTVGTVINGAIAGIIGGGISYAIAKRALTTIAVKLLDYGIDIVAAGAGISLVYTFLKETDVGLSIANWLDARDASPYNGIVWFGK